MGLKMNFESDDKIYFDSNIFIYSIENLDDSKSVFINDFLKSLDCRLNQIITSQLTLLECLVKPRRDRNKELENKYLDNIVNNENIFLDDIDTKTLMLALDIRSKENFQIPDAIHIATAVKNECSAILTNDKHFKVLESQNMKVWYLDDLLN